MSDVLDSEGDDLPLVPLEYDARSYRAGMEIGELKAQLSTHQVSAIALTVRQSNLRPADLIAMLYGYTVRVYGHHGGLCEIEVRKADPEFKID